jgi:hypothetical protein
MAATTTFRETERKYSGEPIDADLAAALATLAAEAINGSVGHRGSRWSVPCRPCTSTPRTFGWPARE